MLSKDKVRKIFVAAVKAITKKEVVSIGDREKFEDYGLDSLDRMNLLLELEERLRRDLGELDLGVLNTFDLLYDKLVADDKSSETDGELQGGTGGRSPAN